CMWHSARSTATIAGSDINPGMFAQNAHVEIGRKPGENFLDVFGLKNATRPLMHRGSPPSSKGAWRPAKRAEGPAGGDCDLGCSRQSTCRTIRAPARRTAALSVTT